MAIPDVTLKTVSPVGVWLNGEPDSQVKFGADNFTIRQEGATCSVVRARDNAAVKLPCSSPPQAVIVTPQGFGVMRGDGLVFGVNPLFSATSPFGATSRTDPMVTAKKLLKEADRLEKTNPSAAEERRQGAAALLFGVVEDSKKGTASRFQAADLLAGVDSDLGFRALEVLAKDPKVPVTARFEASRVRQLAAEVRRLEGEAARLQKNIGSARVALELMNSNNWEEASKAVRAALRRR